MWLSRVLGVIGVTIMATVGIAALILSLALVALGGLLLWLAFSDPEGTPSGIWIGGLLLIALGVAGLVKLWREGPAG